MTLDPIWWLLVVCGLLTVPWLLLGVSRRLLGTATWWAVTAVLLLSAGAALQPGLDRDDGGDSPTGLDVVIVIDRTTSMGAEDYDGDRPRIDGVAADVATLVADLGPARYAVVTSDNVATVAVPWTTDAAAVVSLASTVGWREETYGNGSDIADAAPLAEELLESSAAARPEARRLFVYLGDGEQTAPEPPGSFASLRDRLSGALVLGYGTTEGGRMRVSPDSSDHVTRDGEAQLSHFDEAKLRTLADEVGGSFEHRTGPGAITAPLPAPAPAVVEAADGGGISLVWVPAVLALVPLASALFACTRRWHTARREARG